MPLGQPSGNRSGLSNGKTIDSLIAVFASSSPMTSSHFTLGFSLTTSSLKDALSCWTICGPLGAPSPFSAA